MRTFGVWGPLAAVQLITILTGIWRDLRGDEKMKIPKTSEALRMIALPVMAKALEADEAEQEALELKNFVERLKRKNEQNHS